MVSRAARESDSCSSKWAMAASCWEISSSSLSRPVRSKAISFARSPADGPEPEAAPDALEEAGGA
eukprot:2279406-Alexandrium_andersonii.AAC.1